MVWPGVDGAGASGVIPCRRAIPDAVNGWGGEGEGTVSATRQDWPELARLLGERFPRPALHPGALGWLDEQGEARPLGVACSGGADSLCLLLLVWTHFSRLRGSLTVLHFDHCLRGAESAGDAAFVRDVAEGLGLDLRFGKWQRGPEERPTEEAARTARMAFFRKEMGTGKFALLLGQQRHDIVETQLMRLSRGSGTGGLAAPRPVQPFADGRVHLRPLLTLGSAEIRAALRQLEIPFRIDVTNEGDDFYRNRLRNQVLPAWQKHAPSDVAAGAAAARELLEEDDEALHRWLRSRLPAPVKGEGLDLRPVRDFPRALLRRALQEWLAVEQVSLSRAGFSQLLESAGAGRDFRMSGGPDRFVELSGRRLTAPVVAAPPAPALEQPWPLPVGATVLFPGGASLSARVCVLDSGLRRRILMGQVEPRSEAFLAWDGEALWVRHWLPGDRYRPLGAPGSRKLQDMFTDLPVPREERILLPVVTTKEGIVWTPSLPPAEIARINTVTNQVVQLTYTRGRPV